MTRAAALLLKAHVVEGADLVTSGYHMGNMASANVLEKLGFRVTGHVQKRTARGDDVVIRKMALKPQDWLGRLHLETARLVIRPLRVRDAAALTKIGGQPEVARMMGSVPSPWPMEHAFAWIARSPWRNRPGFRAGVFLRQGGLIGMVGMGPAPVDLGYFIDPAQAGQGFATEAVKAVIDMAFTRWRLDEIRAGQFADNPASGRVLQKLGFEETGTGIGKSAARPEPAAIVQYRLTKAQFDSRVG
jgi:RimJ/RimL family protein N-acetyltransferase